MSRIAKHSDPVITADLKSGSVTMETVGRIAGVSQVTVSRALNDPKKVSAATLKRIQDAIELTGYVPNMVAGALASRRSQLIAALVPSITNVIYSDLMQNFIDVIRGSGYHVLMAETGFSQDEEQAVLSTMLSRRPDGILLTGIHHSPGCKRMLLGAGIPVVEVWDMTENPLDVCIGFSHIKAGEEMAKYAVSHGYEHALIVSAGDERALRRKDSFAAQFSQLTGNAPTEVLYETGATIERGRNGLTHGLKQGFKNGIVMCSSDLLAHGILIEAQSRGLRVPEDIAVLGFGNQNFAPFTLPALSTVEVNRTHLGKQAAEALIARINNQPLPNNSIDIGFEIIARAST
ncbi:LacI family DNA-binding transcriptional regulator [Thalassospira sp. GB04J01]|uniref:LacI family DNA-binding transcriptional regulator n=1 Tax=Thalassospira sp. GB04J01 TaxID=1485225 RepID=UPI000B222952|nr:LacI family DNA-binding transcriptional regulator [Thalassospira sp. GB04J01]